MGLDNKNLVPWDIYVDERKMKARHCLGMLVVPNTASFNHKLYRCRHVRIGRDVVFVQREIHWSEFHRGVLRPAMNWINCFLKHRGSKFYILPWPTGTAKELVILRFVARFVRIKELLPPYNVAVLLDFDNSHAKAKIQNAIREAGQIARCYHFDSERNDCLQCCDLLLGALDTAFCDPTIKEEHNALLESWKKGDKLSDSKAKRLIAGFALNSIENHKFKAYDLRHRREDADTN